MVVQYSSVCCEFYELAIGFTFQDHIFTSPPNVPYLYKFGSLGVLGYVLNCISTYCNTKIISNNFSVTFFKYLVNHCFVEDTLLYKTFDVPSTCLLVLLIFYKNLDRTNAAKQKFVATVIILVFCVKNKVGRFLRH